MRRWVARDGSIHDAISSVTFGSYFGEIIRACLAIGTTRCRAFQRPMPYRGSMDTARCRIFHFADLSGLANNATTLGYILCAGEIRKIGNVTCVRKRVRLGTQGFAGHKDTFWSTRLLGELGGVKHPCLAGVRNIYTDANSENKPRDSQGICLLVFSAGFLFRREFGSGGRLGAVRTLRVRGPCPTR